MKPAHQTFLLEMLSHGDKLRAYQTAYPTASGEAMRTAANRLLRYPAIAEKLAEVQHRAEAQLQQHIQQAAEKEAAQMVSLHEKRLILARMIRGQWKQVKHIKLKDTLQAVENDITPSALLRAIELDCKLAAGKYKEPAAPAARPKPAVAPTIPAARPAAVIPVPQTPPVEVPAKLPPAAAAPPERPVLDYLPAYAVQVYSSDAPATTAAKQGGERWQLYLSLDANLRRLPLEALAMKRTAFEKLSPRQQQLVLQPLITARELLKKQPQSFSNRSLHA